MTREQKRMATIARHKNSPWLSLRWSEGGRQRSRSLKTTDMAEALKAKHAEEATHVYRPHKGVINWRVINLGRYAGTSARSTTARQKAFLAECAIGVLADDQQRFDWLLRPMPRLTILAELGRLAYAPEVLKHLAAQICGLKLGCEAAGAWLRKARRARVRKTPCLAVEIEKAIQHFARVYPQEFLSADVAKTLRGIADFYAMVGRAAA